MNYKILLFTFFVCCSLNSFAQKLSKEELKELKAKKKSMDPSEYLTLKDAYGRLQGEKAKFNRQARVFRKQIKDQNPTIEEKSTEVDTLKNRLVQLRQDCDNNVSKTSLNPTVGVVYKVQIGAYSALDLTEYSSVIGTFEAVEEEELKKYIVAHFSTYEQASNFKEYIQAMGIKDAWVVVYEDNVRKPINDFISKEKSRVKE